jgi:hypothetical protein
MATPHVQIAAANNQTYVTLVNVQGIDGELTGLGVAGGSGYHSFRLTLDGIVVADDFVVGNNTGGASANGGITLCLPFSQTLQVEIRDSPRRSAITRFWAAYVTSHTNPVDGPERRRVRLEEQEYAFETTRYRGLGDSLYTVEALIGPTRWSTVHLYSDTVLRGEEVQGVLELRDIDEGYVYAESANLVVRAAGRTRPLYVHELGSVQGEMRFGISVVDLPERQGSVRELPRGVNLEVAADLPGFANIPASFVVL